MAYQPQNAEIRRKRVGALIILTGVYIVSTLIPFVKIYTQFPLYIVKCGGYPIATSEFARSYTLPTSPMYTITFFSGPYYCSEQDAQRAGYEKYP